MKNNHKNRWGIWVVGGILLFLFSLALDYTHKGIIQWLKMVCVYRQIADILKNIGIRYSVALEILKGILGVLFTTLSLILNMGLNIANRSERKIYGIPRKELEQLQGGGQSNPLRNIIYVFPLLMILCMNLELCATGYTVLFFSYVFLILDYSTLSKSYGKEKKQQLIVNGLLYYVQGENYKDEENLIRYQAMVEDVRKGIQNEEGWRNGELFYESFLESIEQYDYYAKYILTYHFFSCLFHKGKERNYTEELKCVQKVVNRNVKAHIERGCFDINDYSILMGTLSAIMITWTEYELIKFLKWFFDYKARNVYRTNSIIYVNVDSGKKQRAGIVLIFVEYWLQINEKNRILNEYIIEILWEYGKSIFKQDEELLKKMIELVPSTLEEGELVFQRCIENLQEDSNKNRQRSLVCHIIRNFI